MCYCYLEVPSVVPQILLATIGKVNGQGSGIGWKLTPGIAGPGLMTSVGRNRRGRPIRAASNAVLGAGQTSWKWVRSIAAFGLREYYS